VVTGRTQTSRQLVQSGCQEGQEVNKGDFLAQIDSRPYQAALGQTQGQLLRDQAQLANARRDLARFNRLVAENSIAQQQRDTQEALVHQLEGTVATDQGVVDNAKLNLAYCRIVAPVSGRVGLRQVDAGNYVQVSDANGLVVITQIEPISAIFSLPKDNLRAILKRTNAGATLQVVAFDRSGVSKLATGSLVTIDNQIDPTTGTVRLKAVFPNKDEQLWPNEFVNIHLRLNTQQNAIVIPSSAIQRGPQGTFVYVVGQDNTVQVRNVQVSLTQGLSSLISSGVDAGDRVVTDGQERLQANMKVDPRAPQPRGGSQAPGNQAIGSGPGA